MTNIVMITRDRYKLLRQTLTSLFNSACDEPFNLTVVDDGSGDFRIHKLLDGISKRPNVAIIKLINSNHVIADLKSLGVDMSRRLFGKNDWLYLSDNDVYFHLHWLDKITHVAHSTQSSGYRLWGGQVHPYHHPKHINVGFCPKTDDRSKYLNYFEYSILDGPSWLMGWDTWDEFGLRGTTPGVCKGEDGDFCDRLVSAGGRIAVIRPHVVEHTGISNTDGELAPGYEERSAIKLEGVIYE